MGTKVDSLLLPQDETLSLEGKPVYMWAITQDEEERLKKYIPEITKILSGTYLYNQRVKCNNCKKPTEFIDFVYTALKSKIHTIDFIIADLKKPKASSPPPHYVDCSKCHTQYPIAFGWATGHSFVWQKDPDTD
ncbi:hypothetical protein COEREDRAFT_90156 [Coemansia reversa NRRL 1564]|uniref:Uncharacterized protein n=1 Tax=Coemansia reversa (strain ATCC 12441 / NRRL 1564) TaxID=763665 RepID=A0A2G5B1K1_COERN|nr:hypothetical protein COEREDRAFT_90156 [Coemansia reversa NRRL 1564]|eukprot:PIA12597.1 hypothetical protein COEREDRAFT_90156 [Coemansia reversa NRRL 1564]